MYVCMYVLMNECMYVCMYVCMYGDHICIEGQQLRLNRVRHELVHDASAARADSA